MKTILALFAFTIAAIVSYGAIRWQSPVGTPWIRIAFGGTNSVELGLRDDGVVVWREINSVTNSPAEQPQIWGNIIVLTNIMPYRTNFSFGTNVFIPL